MVAVSQLDPPALSTPETPFPTGVTTGPLQPDDRLATDEELADALHALETITHLTMNDLDASDHVRDVHARLIAPMPTGRDESKAHMFFDGAMLSHGGQTKAAYLHRALSQVGTTEQPPGSNHTKYNDWFAGLYGGVYHACAWCAIFQSWVGQAGAIPASKRSAGAEALVANFPNLGRAPGTLIYYTFSHVELFVKGAGGDYAFMVGGNTSDNGQHTDGVWYVHRNLAGVVGRYGMPDYTVATPVHDHLEKNGDLAVTGVFGHYTINHLKRRLSQLSPHTKPLPLNGLFHARTIRALQTHLKIKATGTSHTPTVKALQKHLHVRPDGDWGPATTKALQRRLNAGTF